MTGATNTGNEAPRDGLSAPESLQDPVSGTEWRPGGLNGPQTGAQSRESEPERVEARQPAYDAVYAYIRSSNRVPGDLVTRNAMIWRAVTAALDAMDEYLEIGEEQAWCKACRRVWEGRSHRCESDAERQLAARDAALAAYTAQLVRDQAALAAAKKCARGIGAWGVLQAIDNASTPAPDGGPTVAEAAADDVRWPLEKAGE